MKYLHTLTLVAAIGFWAPVSVAQSKSFLTNTEAASHYARARSHFVAKEYAAAKEEIRAAYEIEPHFQLLYPWAQAERLSGQCDRAVALYETYLQAEPPTEQARLARAHIQTCRELQSKAAVPTEEAEEQVDVAGAGTQLGQQATLSAETHPPWYVDKLGGALVGAGVVGLATGMTLRILSRRDQDSARAQPTHEEFEQNLDRAIFKDRASLVALSAGAGLTLGGLIRYVFVARRASSTQPAVSVEPVARGNGLYLGIYGTF